MKFFATTTFFAFICAFLLLSLQILCVLSAPAPTATPKPTPVAAVDTPPKDADNKDVQILKFDNDNNGVDGYNFFFETSDGVSRKESAKLKNVGTEDEAISVQGWVTWKGPDGVQYTLNYLADENGFQPEGAHLPVAPEV